MAIFNDLAVELQEAIWELVLPTARGVHWIEVEGIPQDPDFIRDSIRSTQSYNFDRIPEGKDEIFHLRQLDSEFKKRIFTKKNDSSAFFRHLLTTVPAAFGASGPDSEQLQHAQADEIAYTRRCRQLSTYTQITTLLSTCRLSRYVAQQRIRDRKCTWPIYRSMGALYRTRPMDVWEAQYSDGKAPPIPHGVDGCTWEPLAPRIHSLDLVVLRLHDSHGFATPLLRQAPWQHFIETSMHGETYGCFDRIALEWHPFWATSVGGALRSDNIKTFVRNMQVGHFPATPYWLVDGVPRVNWKHDYPAVIGDIFAEHMAGEKEDVLEHLKMHWNLSNEEETTLLADHHLGQEFEANGRRYYIVFVLLRSFEQKIRQRLDDAGVGYKGPFPGSAAIWPEAIREPVRLAHDVICDASINLGTYKQHSYILSWEPI